MIGSILLLVDALKNLRPTGISIAQGVDVVYYLLAVAGFAVAGAAFLGGPRDRASKLRIGSALLAGAFGAACIAEVASAIDNGIHHAPGTFVASHAVLGVGDLLIAVAAATAAIAFAHALPSLPSVDRAQRDARLGWTSILLTAGIVFLMISSILSVITFSDVGATSGFTAGLGIAAGGEAVGIGGAVVAAVAFLNSAQRQQEGRVGWLSYREGLLAIAASVLAIAFFITAIGSIVNTSAASANGLDSRFVAAGWLDAIRQLGWMAGITCASVGFFLSRRANA